MKLLEIKNSNLTQQQMEIILTPEVRDLGSLFDKHGFDLRIVGGAVRDLMLGKKPKDIDLATDATPDEMVTFLEKEGLKTIPTGVEHGTITVLGPDTGELYEITTLRIDVETTGRHANVEFTRDWRVDAERRDLTFNAMSIDMEGILYDYFGGAKDLRNYITRFVGDADKRIKEDYLRILRFFRFLSKMEKQPVIGDAEAQAIEQNAEGLLQISGERIWMEMSKILIGNHVGYLLRKMCELGVAEQINLPCSKIVYKTTTNNPITVLSILMNNISAAETVIFQWKLSNPEKKLLLFLVEHQNFTIWNAKYMLVDGVPLEWINELAAKHNQMNIAKKLEHWPVPVFPVVGADLIARNIKPGIEFGNILKDLKIKWKQSQFTLDKDQLLSYI